MVWLALFRAINVGGRNVIRMADLRSDLTALGLDRVETYLQSGNAVFESGLEGDLLRTAIDELVLRRGLSGSGVLLRSRPELRRVVEGSPLAADPTSDRHKFVSFFDREIPSFEFKGARVLSWAHTEVHWTVLDDGPPPTLTRLEKKMGFRSTTRNWTVTNALLQLLEARAP